jgi:2-polyprenyl-3-methyl-5-hydroxy-6-metoxy-1,4-benzoquinol methylase
MRYVKEAFDVTTITQAMNVVLSFESDKPEKFHKETHFLVDTIYNENIITNQSTVLDFGCGMGRVSKELITKFDCSVLGFDISESMKTFATLYVSNPRKFKIISQLPDENSVDVCLAVFVLQHVENPQQEIEKKVNTLKPNGYLVLINEDNRFIPSDVDSKGFVIWDNDNFNVFTAIEKLLTKVKETPYINPEKNIVIYRKQ